MTTQEIYNLVTALRNGNALDIDVFNSLLTSKQAIIEGAREWAILRKTNTLQTANPSDTFQTSKNMPDDFMFWQTEQPVVLVAPNQVNDFFFYQEVPYSWQFDYQFNQYSYACDYLNSKLYILGTVDKPYTIYQNYIYKPTDLDYTLNNTWVFPARFHQILAYDVAVDYKAGIDYDEVNNAGAKANLMTRNAIYQSMIAWDSRLQSQMLTGLDRMGNYNGFTPGRINING